MLHVPSSSPPMGQLAGHTRVRQVLHGFDTAGLPQDFIDRLVADSSGGDEYGRMTSISELRARPANSSYWGYTCGCLMCSLTTLVPAGFVGRLVEGSDYEFLAPGYHRNCCCGVDYAEMSSVNVLDRTVEYGTLGFVTVTEGKVGVMMVGASFKLLAPGSYQWASPRVKFVSSQSIADRTVALGPYMLVTVPENSVAVTFNNGDLIVLGHNVDARAEEPTSGSAPRRTYFLDNPKWILDGFLPMVMQTDRLEENDLLSKDNVEVVMTAMSQWRIKDPVKAVLNCASKMEQIQKKVDQLVRATIARIVAGTNIGAGPVSGAGGRAVVATAIPIDGEPCSPAVKPTQQEDGADMSLLMKSDVGQKHMAELAHEMEVMGIEVCGVYVPEKRIKSDDIRREVAKQAVIGIRADAERAAADAKAYATVKAARAEAEAIDVLARAHADAGNRLGNPETTASRLALSETLAKVVKDAQLTIFSGAPDSMPFMLSGNPRGAVRQSSRTEPAGAI